VHEAESDDEWEDALEHREWGDPFVYERHPTPPPPSGDSMAALNDGLQFLLDHTEGRSASRWRVLRFMSLSSLKSLAAQLSSIDFTRFSGLPIQWTYPRSVLECSAVLSFSPTRPPPQHRFNANMRALRGARTPLDRLCVVFSALMAGREVPARLIKPLNPILGEVAFTHHVLSDATAVVHSVAAGGAA
jgi:hypothetical protein